MQLPIPHAGGVAAWHFWRQSPSPPLSLSLISLLIFSPLFSLISVSHAPCLPCLVPTHAPLFCSAYLYSLLIFATTFLPLPIMIFSCLWVWHGEEYLPVWKKKNSVSVSIRTLWVNLREKLWRWAGILPLPAHTAGHYHYTYICPWAFIGETHFSWVGFSGKTKETRQEKENILTAFILPLSLSFLFGTLFLILWVQFLHFLPFLLFVCWVAFCCARIPTLLPLPLYIPAYTLYSFCVRLLCFLIKYAAVP